MKSIFVLSSFLALAACARAETLFTVPWGNGAGQLGYHNPSTKPFDQPYAEGPGGIALGPAGEIWISDQFNDRILRFDRAGKLVGTAATLGEQKLSRPRSLMVDPGKSVAVVNGTDMAVLWQDVATGKVDRFEKADGKAFPQVEALVGSATGDLWVGDNMWSALFRFDRKGGKPERRPWGLAGVATDAKGRVYTLEFRAAANGKGDFHLVSTDASGKAQDHFPLVAPELESPYLVGLDAAGNAVVRFIKVSDPKTVPKGQSPNRFLLVRYDPAGREGKPLGETRVSVVTQPFTITPEGSVIGLSFDAMTAPEGGVEVVEFK